VVFINRKDRRIQLPGADIFCHAIKVLLPHTTIRQAHWVATWRIVCSFYDSSGHNVFPKTLILQKFRDCIFSIPGSFWYLFFKEIGIAFGRFDGELI
jgi:hypothetical protein